MHMFDTHTSIQNSSFYYSRGKQLELYSFHLPFPYFFFLFKLNNHTVLDFNLISSYSWTFVQTMVVCFYNSILQCFCKVEAQHVGEIFVSPWAHVHTDRLCGCLPRVRFPNKWILFFSLKKQVSSPFHIYIPSTHSPQKLRHKLSNFNAKHVDATLDTVLRAFHG